MSSFHVMFIHSFKFKYSGTASLVKNRNIYIYIYIYIYTYLFTQRETGRQAGRQIDRQIETGRER